MTDLTLDLFDYDLPPERIAQTPLARRDASRLMVLDRQRNTIEDTHFHRLPHILRGGDLLVMNRSRVIPARVHARRAGGGHVELLLLREPGPATWYALIRPSRKIAPGDELRIEGSNLVARVVESRGEGEWELHFTGEGEIREALLAAGSMPLPPYIHEPSAPERYQTVYADREGSVAAPTAGLHFSPDLMEAVRAAGVETAFVTLHVGPGTFRPVKSDRIAGHHMHSEWGEVPAEVADTINRARAEGRRVIAVGTTTTRLLESAWQDQGVSPFQGETRLFIYPGYTFRVINGLITNFHLPRSTLLMLVSALAGREFILEAYREAVQRHYRFYSFGDAMLIL